MKTTGNHLSLRKFCVLLLMMVSYTDTYVLAAPKGGQVVSGTASIQQNGNLTIITAGNRSVINYGSFNIAAGETVKFVQPSANSSVLNRVVGSANPTEIFGTLQANGHVFIANPYGIFFRNGSVINVGGLYAGAGNLSDADFTKGKIHFTDLAGDVRNDGIILADNHLALMGVNVVNTGTLKAGTGLAMMVSGKDVYVGEKKGNIFVQANGNPAAATTAGAASGSIVNSGTVAAPARVDRRRRPVFHGDLQLGADPGTEHRRQRRAQRHGDGRRHAGRFRRARSHRDRHGGPHPGARRHGGVEGGHARRQRRERRRQRARGRGFPWRRHFGARRHHDRRRGDDHQGGRHGRAGGRRHGGIVVRQGNRVRWADQRAGRLGGWQRRLGGGFQRKHAGLQRRGRPARARRHDGIVAARPAQHHDLRRNRDARRDSRAADRGLRRPGGTAGERH